MTTIIVSSVVATKYLNGGNAWVILSWMRGLERLGCRVHFVEQLARESCVDAAGKPSDFEGSINLHYFQEVTRAFGLEHAATLVFDGGARTEGLTMADLQDLASETDLLLNITGHLTLEPVKRCIKKKAYVDLDPGYTQLWQSSGNAGARLQGHDYYLTVGENIGTHACALPTGEIPWKPIRPPVVLADWPVRESATQDRFTTIASWRGAYGRVQWKDKLMGQKAHEFRKFVDLPRRVPHSFEIALDIHPDDSSDRRTLVDSGWHLVEPHNVASDPAAFQAYVQASGAEFSPAQGIYVEARTGWFSDRTVRYLASGKPALVQDTGFCRDYAAGGGLVPFSTLDEAVAGAERIASDYAFHSHRARELAEEYFDSDRVLGQMMKQVELA